MKKYLFLIILSSVSYAEKKLCVGLDNVTLLVKELPIEDYGTEYDFCIMRETKNSRNAEMKWIEEVVAKEWEIEALKPQIKDNVKTEGRTAF